MLLKRITNFLTVLACWRQLGRVQTARCSASPGRSACILAWSAHRSITSMKPQPASTSKTPTGRAEGVANGAMRS